MTTECAVCYVTDRNFLWPTLASAGSLRQFVSPQKADIYIFVLDGDVAEMEELTRFATRNGMIVMPLDSRDFGSVDDSQWNVTHVPKSTLGRFFISELLPQGHKRILYLDGDTWINADPSALIDYPIPEGRLAAVEDISYFSRHDITGYGKFVRDYFRGIGIEGNNGYLNAGVFLVSANTWPALAAETFAYLKANAAACRFHDQSALNAVIGDRRLHLSLAWNFQTPYRYWNIENRIAPRIYHFTQFPKPWMGPVKPWTHMYPRYEHKMNELSGLNLPRRALTTSEINAANTASDKQQWKLNYPLRLRLWRRRKAVETLEKQALSFTA
jgi:lipopolysaccharide biosynthesis glycosyltransferase